ncbi:glycosyltransferase family 61 protein [uncultured Methylobacterium sp.]|uniref:glycosyltransferase 61 family protein n=1 Tax=uncultured Methylobacterium sp. TaxID=157278 RepID=UPI0025864E36|nr:glycosyltransferase family 61 protein [uncultured Methylobacterium sp.]
MFYTIMNEFIADLVGRYAGMSEKPEIGRHIYISRHPQRQSTLNRRHTMRNEAEIMQIAQENVFTIVCPEQMLWHDQIRVFNNAKSIVGEEGSAMHNILFSPSGSVVATVPQGTHVQTSLSSLKAHSIIFLPAINIHDSNEEISYTIDRTRAAEMFHEIIARTD